MVEPEELDKRQRIQRAQDAPTTLTTATATHPSMDNLLKSELQSMQLPQDVLKQAPRARREKQSRVDGCDTLEKRGQNVEYQDLHCKDLHRGDV